MLAVVINANREGYSLDQLYGTLTVGDLIAYLSDFDDELPIVIGNDKQHGSWYTFGSISYDDIQEYEEEEESYEDDEE